MNAISAPSFSLRPKFVEQRLSLFEIERVEAFGALSPRSTSTAVKATLQAVDTIKFRLLDHCGRRVTGQLGPVPC